MRVAAANAVSLAEVLGALQVHYPAALRGVRCLDWQVPEPTLAALAQFCRVPVAVLEALDLRQRVVDTQPLLLRFPTDGTTDLSTAALDSYDRCHEWRLRYGYCVRCLSTQAVPHIRWDWCLAALIRCSIHRAPLQDDCPHCGDRDALHFAEGCEPAPPRCQSCGSSLGVGADSAAAPCDLELDDAIADAYRAVLRGVAPHPKLLGKATAREFRNFVHDMLELLERCVGQPPPYLCGWDTDRHDLMQIVGDLVRTAAPSANPKQQRRRYSRALVLWGMLVKFMGPTEGEELCSRSLRWPPALRRRWNSALLRRQRRRWPRSPFSDSAYIDAQANFRALVAARADVISPAVNCQESGG